MFQTTDQPFLILHNGAILRYADLIEGQYVFQPNKIIELPATTNSADTKSKKEAKPRDIKLWHLCMRYLGYKSLITLKNLSIGIHFKEPASSKLCGDC